MADPAQFDELDLRAAEAVLGLVDSGERAEVFRDALRDPEMAARLTYWRTVESGWMEEVEPVEPSAGSFSAIDARIGGSSDAPSEVRSQASPGTRLWAIAASIVAVACAGSLLAVIARQGGDASAPRPDVVAVNDAVADASTKERDTGIAQIDGADGVLLSALYHPDGGTLSLRVADIAQPDLVPELWVIPADGKPRSLGLIEQDRVTITLSPELRRHLVDGATMAITLEPSAGAPHDQPSGDILGTTQIQALEGRYES